MTAVQTFPGNTYRRSVNTYQSKDRNFRVGNFNIETAKPELTQQNRSKGTSQGSSDGNSAAPTEQQQTTGSSISLGNIAISATALEGQMQQAVGPGAINAKVKLGTVAAYAGADFRSNFPVNTQAETLANTPVNNLTDKQNKTQQGNTYEMDLSATIGAEAIAIETTVGVDITLSTQSFNNLLQSFYENAFDPAVDFLTGRDAPELPSPLIALDHSLSLSGKISSGWGSALKLDANASISEQGYSIQTAVKVTPTLIGPTTGVELAVTLK